MVKESFSISRGDFSDITYADFIKAAKIKENILILLSNIIGDYKALMMYDESNDINSSFEDIDKRIKASYKLFSTYKFDTLRVSIYTKKKNILVRCSDMYNDWWYLPQSGTINEAARILRTKNIGVFRPGYLELTGEAGVIFGGPLKLKDRNSQQAKAIEKILINTYCKNEGQYNWDKIIEEYGNNPNLLFCYFIQGNIYSIQPYKHSDGVEPIESI